MHSTVALVAFLFLLAGSLGWLPSDVPMINPQETLTTTGQDKAVFDSELRERELYSLASRLCALEETDEDSPHVPSRARDPGGIEVFWVADRLEGGYFPSSTTLGCKTDSAYFWVEKDLEIDREALSESARRFEERIFPVVKRYFGRNWRGGSRRIHVVNGRIPGVGGYFSSADRYPREVNPYSNQGDIIYINVANAPPGSARYEGTLAHELQHLMHLGQDGNEDCWVNEGASELAMALAGYPDWRFAFAQSPDVQLTAWDEGVLQASAHYEASYLFMEYFRQRAGVDLVTELIACPANGTRGFDEVLRGSETSLTFEDLFADWVVANYLDDLNVDNGHFGYRDVDVQIAATHKHYLYPAHRSATVHQYAADYIDLEAGPGDVEITFYGLDQTKLVSVDPHSGEFAWWSNRGDLADTSLTRAFDLRGVAQASLRCWLWYDIERDYDYAYVEVSGDGGISWKTLAGQHTTQGDPNGLNLGDAFTGRSGGGDASTWVEEAFDLTPYSGREILVRFEYVTDDAYNGEGLCVDDIAIPEIGYLDDVEGSEEGWLAEGFIRTDNRVPQRFVVRIITFGDQVQVSPLSLGEDGRGKAIISDLGGATSRATLVVAAMAPKTLQTARYWYSVVPLRH